MTAREIRGIVGVSTTSNSTDRGIVARTTREGHVAVTVNGETVQLTIEEAEAFAVALQAVAANAYAVRSELPSA